MRYLLIPLLLLPASLIAQSPDWQHAQIGRSHLLQPLSQVRPSAKQMRIAIKYLSTHPTGGSDEGLEGVGNIPPTFAAMLLGQRPLVLVTAHGDCSGATGNESRWLLDLSGGRPRVLAGLSGWGVGVQRPISHGLHDFVTASHLSAFETELQWYRFDGKQYRNISKALAYSSNYDGPVRMLEERQRCAAAHEQCNFIWSRF